MKYYSITLFLLGFTFLFAQTNTAVLYLNDISTNGIQATGNTATGQYSFSIGHENQATGFGSVSLASSSVSSGIASVAIGDRVTASGDYGSTAIGLLTTASGNSSFAGGNNTTSSGAYSFAFGENSISSGGTSVAFGFGTESSGLYSTSFGVNSNANGNTSAAMGYGTIASDYGSLVVGVNNLSGSTVTSDADYLDLSNTAFVIGNGLDESNRSDALVVKFDGTTTIAGDLNVNSDARLKTNIISLGATLSKVLQIDGKSYSMKNDKYEKQKIGLLAQDIEKVFPELVSENNGVKSVNYQGIVPILINALKEQDEKIKDQQSQINRLENLIQEFVKL